MDTIAGTPATPLSAVSLDAAAVAAVREGDTRRYRELVERHERRVYAVAWSRLGDASLAEDATQEAFIRAYRYLPMLDNGEKFAAWISTIARNSAIALGLRNRRELQNRERWAIEQPTAMDTPAEPGISENTTSAETLRRTLVELPPAHRECLVLFHIEGKSGAETAAALGISEGALRVRLHRARAALRTKLEERLGKSLEQLRPVHSLAAPVMAALLVSPGGKIGGAAGAGGGAFALAGKFFPAGLVMFAIQTATLVPGMLFQSWLAREERRNYRDTGGFRLQLHRGMYRKFFWMFPAMFLLTWLAQRVLQSAWGIQGVLLATGIFSLALAAISARLLVINRSAPAKAQCVYCLALAAVMISAAAHWLPLEAVMLAVVGCSGVMAVVVRRSAAHLRLDWNLFLRAAQGMLPEPAPEAFDPRAVHTPRDLTAFARFLAGLGLAANFRWQDEGLALRLPAVQPGMDDQIRSLLFPLGLDDTRLHLHFDGTVEAKLGARDRRSLARMMPMQAPDDAGALEARVEAAVLTAWHEFRAGRLSHAERALGQMSETDIFVAPPKQARATRATYWMLGLAMVLAMFSWVMFDLSKRLRPPSAPSMMCPPHGHFLVDGLAVPVLPKPSRTRTD